MKWLLALPVILLAGCVKTGVTHSDSEANREAFSQEAYEKAMIKAGHGEALAQEKALSEKRRAEERGRE